MSENKPVNIGPIEGAEDEESRAPGLNSLNLLRQTADSDDLPSAELAADVGECFRAARASLAAPGGEPSPPCPEHAPTGGTGIDRDRGRFAEGTTVGLATRFRAGVPGPRLTHGGYSQHRWRELLPLRQEWRRQWLADKGHDEADVPLGLSLLIDAAIELRLKSLTYFQALVDGPGPVTATGRRARIAEHNRKEVEAFARVVMQIGLRREPKPAPSLAEFLASRAPEEENRNDHTDQSE